MQLWESFAFRDFHSFVSEFDLASLKSQVIRASLRFVLRNHSLLVYRLLLAVTTSPNSHGSHSIRSVYSVKYRGHAIICSLFVWVSCWLHSKRMLLLRLEAVLKLIEERRWRVVLSNPKIMLCIHNLKFMLALSCSCGSPADRWRVAWTLWWKVELVFMTVSCKSMI